jgi:hypothetical protein
VLSFFSSRRNWDSPNPSPAGECAPPPPVLGEGHTRWRERGWESPNSDEGTYTVVLFTYTYFVGPVIETVAKVRELIWMEEGDRSYREKKTKKETGQGMLEIGEKDYEEGGYCRGKKKELQSRESRKCGAGREHCKETMPKICNNNSQKRNCAVSPNFHIHVSMSDLYIPMIGLPILQQENYVDRFREYMNRSQTHEYGNLEIGTEAAQLFWEHLIKGMLQ